MKGRASLLAMVAGTGLVQCLPAMPGSGALLPACLALVVLTVAAHRRAGARAGLLIFPLWAFVAAFGVTLIRVEHRLADALAPENENKVSRVVLRVAALPTLREASRMFEAEVLSSRPAGVPTRILVSWAAPDWGGPYGRAPGSAPHELPALIPGQIWSMALTLRRPHGARNPYGFDYEAHLYAQGIRATGSVRGTPRLLGDQPWAGLSTMAERARHHVRVAMEPHLLGRRYGAVLLALAIGDQASVAAEDWEVFNRTGITHLVSISGSHITMIAAMGGLATWWAWRRIRFRGRNWAERVPAQIAAALAALWVAWLYCLLAGWGVPARRTFLMLSVVALAHVLRLPLNAGRLLCLVAFVVLALDPWALMASGFWLSFGAVAVLMTSAGWWGQALIQQEGGRMRRLWRAFVIASALQLAITAALMPVLALIFHEVSLASPFANAYAIPVISLIVTPVALLAAAAAMVPGLDAVASALAWTGHAALEACMIPTVWLSRFGPASFAAPAAPLAITIVALAGMAVAVLPHGFPRRHAGWLLMLPALFWKHDPPFPGDWTAHVLDVGQGSAIVVETARSLLLFDTGARSSADSDQGARTIVPFLRAMGRRRVDVLVISHSDLDHAGGAGSVLAHFPVQQSYSSFDLGAYLRRDARLLDKAFHASILPPVMSSCEAGLAWEVDEVHFEFLWPDRDRRGDRAARPNDVSCVLLIRGARHALLLTGDIGVRQEAALLQRGLGEVDVVLAAHHGSKSSSGKEFVQRVRASHVLAQAGAWSRFGHPAPTVQRRWEQAGARFWRTDRDGAVSVRSAGGRLQVAGQRDSHRRLWQSH